MEGRPSFLGRGRGRAQKDQKGNHASRSSKYANGSRDSTDRQPGVATSTAWSSGPPLLHAANRRENSQEKGDVNKTSMVNERQKKAEEIRKAAAKFYTSEETYSSDSDEDVNDDEIFDNTLKTYQGDEDNLIKIKQYLQDSCNSKALTCLICIASVKHNDAIWNCGQCYSIFHLHCIQKWSTDGAVKNLPLSQELFPRQEINWFCPKCRCEYKQSERPTRYFCFCGKAVNPKFDPWSVPHSCGETCERGLDPDCGHSCLLLCHPGPCPPCPKMVQSRCHCGSQPPTSRRCSAKAWSCGKPCAKLLSCGHHKCSHPCHAGQCPACPEQSSQPCYCGRNTSIRPCSEPDWLCTEVCGRLLECGNHTCADVCHRGKCSLCPRSGKRTCPCGKTTFNLPCNEDVPLCGDTCELVLECGRHNCTRRCHSGCCETCRQMVTKICRCGKKEKSIQCSQEFTCDVKCFKLRVCQRHQCRRKCCDNQCPPCEQICGRLLSCKNHKCPSVCHQGFCYPCPLTQDVFCNCGSTKLSVPCGRERMTKPPKCSQLCKEPSNCHHMERKPHRCHFGPCPSCKEICGNDLSSCDHTCPLRCHDNKMCKSAKSPALTFPWTANGEEKAIPVPCPPCTVSVTRSCLGEHETVSMACSELRPFSCGRPCRRLQVCTNHFCRLECHTVTHALDEEKSGSECEQCELPCSKRREPDCMHECLRKCHPDECGECKQMVKRQCHCSAIALYVKCSELISSDKATKVTLLSCKGNCPKALSCGHRCSLKCHPGPCLDVRKCSKKTIVRCPCKRMKKDYPCFEASSVTLDCNDDCKKLQIKTEEERKELERIQHEEEMKLDQEEVERYERKRHGRKRRARKQLEEVLEPSWLSLHKNVIFFSVLGIAILAFIIHIAVVD